MKQNRIYESRIIFLVIPVMLFVLVIITGCDLFKGNKNETYKVGALFAITGPASWLGEPEKNTVEMIEKEINAQGGINGHPLKIIVKDTAGEKSKTIMAVNKLILKDEVLAIVGPSRSGSTMAIIPIVEKHRVPMVSCAAAEKIINPVSKWVFKTPQNDSDAVKRIYEKTREMGITSIAIISDTTAFGKSGKEQLEKFAPEMGITIVANEIYNPEDTDMTAQLLKIKTSNAQAIVNWSIVPAQTLVIRKKAQLGITLPLFQSHGFGNVKYARVAGESADGVIFPGSRLLAVDTLPENHPQKKVLTEYKKAYEEKFRSEVSTFGGHAYDALHLIIEALRKVGPDNDKIRTYIENKKNFIGTGGVFNFSPEDHVGLKKDAFEMLTVNDGYFTVLK